MQQGERITVIVPIDNAEKQIDRCVKSIVTQTYNNLEILLIDDGSTDGSSKICDAWQGRDERINVIHKRKEGLAMARNEGIDQATGAYIMFCDGDGYFTSDAVEKCYRVAYAQAVQIVCFGVHIMEDSGQGIRTRTPRPDRFFFKGCDVTEKLLPDLIAVDPHTGKDCGLTVSAYTMMFSRELIQQADWHFVSEREIISDDLYSIVALFRNVERAAVIPAALYYDSKRRRLPKPTYRLGYYEKIRHAHLRIIALSDECGYNEQVRRRLSESYLLNTITAMNRVTTSGYVNRQKLRTMRFILKDDVLHSVLKEVKHHCGSFSRKFLLLGMRMQWWQICYVLAWLRIG